MPIYEYRCSGCDLKFELLRSLAQANEGADCPRCHTRARRMFSTFASFSKSSGGDVVPIAGSGSGCSTCSSPSCSSCGL